MFWRFRLAEGLLAGLPADLFREPSCKEGCLRGRT